MPSKKYNIKEGDTFDFLSVIKEADPIVYSSGKKRKTYLVRCSCGVEFIVKKDTLTCNAAIHKCEKCAEPERKERRKRPSIAKMATKNRKVFKGMVVDRVTVLGEKSRQKDRNGNARVEFFARCECGSEFIALNSFLLNKKIYKQCPQCRTFTKPGAKFGNLTVLHETDPSFSKIGHKLKNILVKCDCGNEFETKATSILNKNGVRRCKTCQPLFKEERSGIKPGARFGDLQILKFVEDHIQPNGHKVKQFLTRCVCGVEDIRHKTNISRRKSYRCNHFPFIRGKQIKPKDVFGRLTVLSFFKKNETFYAHCLCSCGSNYDIRVSHLLKNKEISCGCARKRIKRIGSVSFAYFNSIIDSAKRRQLPFDITIEYLNELYESQKGLCALSGVQLEPKLNPKDYKATASVDRINSKEGYVIGNVQWVHKDVNRMKQDYPQEVFLEWCLKIISTKGNK